MFFWNSLAFSMIQRMLAIWSLVLLPFLNPACTSGSSQFTNCWSAVDSACSREIKRRLLLGRTAMTNLDSILKKQRHYFSDKDSSSQSYRLSSGHVRMWDLDHKESWTPKNWYFQIVVLEKTLQSPLDSKESKPVHPKGNQLWIFIGSTDAEANAPKTLATWCKELTH